MAPLLRASIFRGFRLVSSLQQELRRPRPHHIPESHCVVRSLYGGSAAMEETQPTNNIAGAGTTEGDIASEMTDEAQKCGTSKDASQRSNAKQEGLVDQSSDTDKISGLILDQMRSNNATDGTPLQKELPSMKHKSFEETSVNDDKWAQVLSSMQKMAAKNRASLIPGPAGGCGDRKSNLMSGGSGGSSMSSMLKSQGENDGVFTDLDDESSLENDFADLDSPQGHHESKPGKAVPQGPTTDTFSVSNKHKNGSLQGDKQKDMGFKFLSETKTKDTKPTKGTQVADLPRHPVSFNFPAPQESKGAFSGLGGDDKMPSEMLHISDNLRAAPPVSGFTACIENLPTHCDLALVKEVLSIHGEIISSFKKYNKDNTFSTYIEFKLAEALDSALASGFLQFDRKAFSIIRANPPSTTVVRLSKVSGETSENQLLFMCSKFGDIDNIRRRGNGVYDVFYQVHELPNMPRILTNLSAVTVSQRRLVALPAPLLHPAARKDVLSSSEGQAWHASQISLVLNQIEGDLDTVSVCFEDLKALTAMEDELVS